MPRTRSAVAPALAVLIVAGVLAGLFATFRRAQVETRNRRVEIGMEFSDADTLAETSGIPLHTLLEDYKAQGLSALIITEDTLANLEPTGIARPRSTQGVATGHEAVVTLDGAATLNRVRLALQDHGAPIYDSPGKCPTPWLTEFVAPGSAQAWYSTQRYAHLRLLGIGLPPHAVQAARQANLLIAARTSNFPGVALPDAERVLEDLGRQGASIVIFAGDDVLGYRGMERSVADLLRPAPGGGPSPSGLLYGAVEFGKQRGDSVISSALDGDYIRVHSVQTAEMGQMTEPALLDRFALAVRERNIRFCYVRMLTFDGKDAAAVNAEYIRKIAQRMQNGSQLVGGRIQFGQARPFGSPRVPAPVYPILGLATAAGAVWAVQLLLAPGAGAGWLLLALLAATFGLLSAVAGGRPLVALAAGITFPLAGLLLTYPGTRSAAPTRLPARASLAGALGRLGLASAVTAVGIVLVVGLLSARPYLVEAKQFMGIKAQHALPIVILAVIAMAGGPALAGERWPEYRRRAGAELRGALNEPARYGVLALAITALAALAFILIRTGNDTGIGVSSVELKFRAVLDRLLPVRPRTKEVLVGHPAFVLALALWFSGRRKVAVPLFLVGAIGQVSLLNTFCHLHTPLAVSMWRGALGLLIGAAIGSVLFYAVEILFPVREPAPVQSARDEPVGAAALEAPASRTPAHS